MQQVLIITDALWTRSAILALLALYEAKINMLDNHKKKKEEKSIIVIHLKN